MTDETMTQEEQLILVLKEIKLKVDELNYNYAEVDNGYFYLLEISNIISEKIKKLKNQDFRSNPQKKQSYPQRKQSYPQKKRSYPQKKQSYPQRKKI